MNTLTKPSIAILMAPGTNCHEETAHAVEQAGGRATFLLMRDLLDSATRLTDHAAFIIPGGFSWGDHLAAGRLEAIHLISCLREQMQALLEDGKPILGICNGFQVLTETGLLPDRQLGERRLALLQNKSARFESRLVKLIFQPSHCIFTTGLAGKVLTMPVAHGEGRLSAPDKVTVVCQYADSTGHATDEYPANPNGSPRGIAGITDSTGLIFGLMPHPERVVEEWHPSTDGRMIFQNMVNFLKES